MSARLTIKGFASKDADRRETQANVFYTINVPVEIDVARDVKETMWVNVMVFDTTSKENAKNVKKGFMVKACGDLVVKNKDGKVYYNLMVKNTDGHYLTAGEFKKKQYSAGVDELDDSIPF